MAPAHTLWQDLLVQLLEDLDAAAHECNASLQADDEWVCQRRHERRRCRAPCVVSYLPIGASKPCRLVGRTRNLSPNGVSVLVRRVFSPGEVTEVALSMPDQAPMYLTGLVRFCCYRNVGYHEVGIELKSAGHEPVLTTAVARNRKLLAWLELE